MNNGDTGDVAIDHYHRWEDDVALMKDLELQAYRFSISWPRILPAGRGQVNPAGIDFYSKLVDGLLKAEIEPCITLYHWDLPQELEDDGGWPDRMIVDAFNEYAEVVTRALGDRVKYWTTFNEPWVTAFIGYKDGFHAPGIQDFPAALAAAHHLLVAHGKAVPVIRANVPDAEIGITLNLTPQELASGSLADRQQATWVDGYNNRWFLDPLAGRHYPADMVDSYKTDLPFLKNGDYETIVAPIDFLGVNYYTRNIARSETVPEEENDPREVFPVGKISDMGWETYPPGLTNILARLHFDYGFSRIYITENGAAFPDRVEPDGRINDKDRLEYVRGHIKAIARAIAMGVPVAGYFIWSLFDNFEWAFGYDMRFGVVHVNFDTQQRIPKESALWYRDVIRSHSIPQSCH